MRNATLALLLLPLVTACATNSDRSHRGRPVTPDGPWPALVRTLGRGERPDTHATRAGVQQLEDVVEHAATAVLGRDVDSGTPPTVPRRVYLTVVEVGEPRPRTRALDGWFQDADPLGIKYVVDHLGPDGLDELPRDGRPAAVALAHAVADHVYGDGPLEAALPEVRRLERALGEAASLSEDALADNATRFDASAWERSAYTTAPGLFRRARVHLTESLLVADPTSQVFVYAHELFHALSFELEPRGTPAWIQLLRVEDEHEALVLAQARLELEELSAQAFAVLVVEELARSGLVPGVNAVRADALPGDLPTEAGRDPWTRLLALYRSSPALASRELIQRRYGYGTSADRLARVDRAMRRHGVEPFARALAGSLTWEALERELESGPTDAEP